MRHWFSIISLVLLISITAHAADRKITLDSLNINDSKLCVSFHIDGLLSNKTIQGLERGLTSEVFHQVRLWKSKKLFSSIVAENNILIKVLYDNWEDKFRVVTPGENRLTTQVQTVRDICALIRDHQLINFDDLDHDAKYYLSIQTVLKPVSAETYHELSDWLSGQSQTETKEKPKNNKIFGMFLNLLGFGETELNYKSVNFRVSQSGDIILME